MKHQRAIEVLAQTLRDHYGAALHGVVVFGSVARGSASDQSDVDILVILDQGSKHCDWRTEREIRSLVYPIELDEDVVFDLKVADLAALSGLRGHTPFMEGVLADGVSV